MGNPRTTSVRLLALLAVLALLTAACGDPPGGDGDAEEGEADIGAEDPTFTWAVTGADAPTMEAVAELWNEENPDRQVNLVLLPPEADDQRQQLFQDQVTQEGRFDVLGMDVIWTGEFAEAGLIESLEEHRDEVEGVSIPGAIESASWQEELFALPFSTNFGFLYYRTDLVDEPPETWDELAEQVQEIQETEDIGGYIGQGDSYEGFVVNWLELLWSAGGDVFSEDQSQSVLLEGDAAERSLTWLRDAFEDEVLAPGFNTANEDAARNLFQQGDAIFMRNWPYALPLVRGEDPDDPSEVEDNVGIAPLPSFEGDQTISTLGGLNNALSTLSENPEDATDFIVWAATDEGPQNILADMQPPPTMESIYEERADDELYGLLNEVRDDARARPPVPGYNNFSLAVQDHLYPVYSQGEDMDSALQAVNQAAEEALVEEIDIEEEAEEGGGEGEDEDDE